MRIQKSPCDEDDFSSIFKRLVERLTVEDLRLVAFVARQIWFQRNGVVFKEEFHSSRELILDARNQMNQFDQATTKRNKDDSIRANMGKSGTGQWTKPPSGVIKINWDVAWDSHTATTGLGTVAINYEGWVMAMSSSTHQHISHPTTAKTLAAWPAVVLGVQLGATYLELEGDALEVVQGLNQANLLMGMRWTCFERHKDALLDFNAWQVKYVQRETNGAAHRLARLALLNGIEHTWHDNFPLSVLKIVNVE